MFDRNKEREGWEVKRTAKHGDGYILLRCCVAASRTEKLHGFCCISADSGFICHSVIQESESEKKLSPTTGK